jgi:hypothetical protein
VQKSFHRFMIKKFKFSNMSSKLQINEILFFSYSQNNGSIEDTCALSNCAYYTYNIVSLNTILTRLVSKLLTKVCNPISSTICQKL